MSVNSCEEHTSAAAYAVAEAVSVTLRPSWRLCLSCVSLMLICQQRSIGLLWFGKSCCLQPAQLSMFAPQCRGLQQMCNWRDRIIQTKSLNSIRVKNEWKNEV